MPLECEKYHGGGTRVANKITERDIRIPDDRYREKDNAESILRCPFLLRCEREVPGSGRKRSPA